MFVLSKELLDWDIDIYSNADISADMCKGKQTIPLHTEQTQET